MRHLLIIFFCCSVFGAHAQKTVHLHIVTKPGNQLPGFPYFHFTINEQEYKLKAGQCLEKTVISDSIHLVVEDKRWVKRQTANIHIAADKNDVYILVQVVIVEKNKMPVYGAELICQSCYEEIKVKCKKEFSE